MKPRTRKWLLAGATAGVLGGLALAGVFSYVLVVAPHMVHQPHLRAYEAAVPLPPEGSVPVTVQAPQPPAATGPANPLAATPANLERGAVYYGYYCRPCHGRDGAGHGPVGESYMPVPADLRSPRFRAYGDRRLLVAMLDGVGHAPVLSGVVPEAHRWYLVLYLRHLAHDRGD